MLICWSTLKEWLQEVEVRTSTFRGFSFNQAADRADLSKGNAAFGYSFLHDINTTQSVVSIEWGRDSLAPPSVSIDSAHILINPEPNTSET